MTRRLRFRGRLSASGGADAVLERVQSLRKELAAIEQDTMDTSELDAHCDALKQKDLLQHKNKRVRASVACCLSDMLRLYAPNAPFSEGEIAQIFAQFLAQLTDPDTGLGARDAPGYSDTVYLLESLSTVKSVALVCDVPNASKLVAAYVSQLLELAGDDLATNVELYLTDVLVQLVEEGAALPKAALDALMHAFDEDASPNTTSVAAAVCRATQDRLQKHVAQYFAEGMRTRKEPLEEIHARIVCIAGSVPSLLTSVVPQLEAELAQEDAETRALATQVLASLFALPSPAAFAQQYASAWKAWQSRAIDRQAAVRLDWVAGALRIAASHAALGQALAEPLSGRVGDPDERVRQALAHGVGALDYETLRHALPAKVLRQLALRGKDRKAAVRDAALHAVGRAYELAYPELRRDPGATEHFAWIPAQVLPCALAGTPDVVHSVAEALDTHILPVQAPNAYVARLAYVWRVLDEEGRAALYYYTNLRLQRPGALDAFLAAWEEGAVSPDVARAAAAVLRLDAAALERVAAWHDEGAFADLRLAFDAETPLADAYDARQRVALLAADEAPDAAMAVAMLARAGSYPILNTSCVLPLLDEDAPGLRAYLAEAPQLLVPQTAALAERAIAAPDAPTLALLAALAAASPDALAPDALAVAGVHRDALLSALATACDALPVAPYAAAILAHVGAPQLSTAVATFETHVALGSDAERASAYAALGAVAECDVHAVRVDTLIEQIVELLLGAWTADDVGGAWPGDELAWTPGDALQVRLAALHCLVGVLLGEASVERARPVLKLLYVVAASGEARAEVHTPPHAAARMRLAAARSLVRLGECAAYLPLIVPRLSRLAHVLQDEEFDVRSRLLHTLLVRLARGALPPTFHALLYIVALDPEDEMRTRVATYLKRSAAALPEPARHQLDVSFVRLLHLLAHHPDFRAEGEELVHFAQYLDFFLACHATEANIGTLMQCATQVKAALDATAAPSDALGVLGELAQLVVQRTADAHGWNVPHAAPESLPSDLYASATDEGAAQRRFLSERVVELVQRQGTKRAKRQKKED